jgi:multidrug efflux system membrane fusion protein
VPEPETPSPPRRRGYRWGLLALVVIVAAIAAYFYYKPVDPGAQKAGATPQADAQGGGRGARGGGPGGGGRQGQGAQGNRPLPVIAEDAKSGDMEVYLNALGSVNALNSVIVRARVDGQLMRVAFNEGQRVRAGDVLAEIDPRPFQVQLAQAEGQMAKDQALLRNAGSTSSATRSCSPRTRSRGSNWIRSAHWSASTRAPSRPIRVRSTMRNCS